MKRKRSHFRILAVLLLALVCIGGTELVVCRFMDPALFARVTAPAVSAFHSVCAVGAELFEKGAALTAGAMDSVRDTLAPPKDDRQELDSQEASTPSIFREIVYADPAITRLDEREEGDILTGGSVEIPYYCQCAEPWASQPYGRDDIGRYGCGPTALAMVVSSLSDQTVDPSVMAQWAYENGYWAHRGGSYLGIVAAAAEAYGLSCESFPSRDADSLRRELSAGRIFVALMGPGHFTSGGHFIVLRGATLDGSILVADPSSLDRSLTTWDAETILGELAARASDGAPLWMLYFAE